MAASTSSAGPAGPELELSPPRNGDARASTSNARDVPVSPIKKPSNVVYEYSEGGGKSDLKKRRRMRYYILLDPGDEDRKPWLCIAICAALILCLVFGIVLIVVFVRLGDPGDDSSDTGANTDTLIGGPEDLRLTDIADCPQLAQLFSDSVATLEPDLEDDRRSQWFADDQPGRPSNRSIVDGSSAARQTDILVPGPSLKPPEEHYVASGGTLKVIAAGDGGANVSVTYTLDLLSFDNEPASVRRINITRPANDAANIDSLTLQEECGLRDTFRARALALAPQDRPGAARRRLVVVGSSIECIGVHTTLPEYPARGVRLGPRLLDSKSVEIKNKIRADDEFSNDAIRLFPSTVAIVVEVGGGRAPRVLSAAQYEGDFERLHSEGDAFAWLFVSQATHQPHAPPESNKPFPTLTDGEIMPVYRTRARGGGGGGAWEAWRPFRPVGGCRDVRAMVLPGAPLHDRQLLTVAPLPLGRGGLGVIRPEQHSLFVVSWDDKGQRVLTADTADDRGTVARAWLFQTFENPGAPGPASADTPLPTAAPGDAAAATAAAAAAPLVTATYSTAIAAFALRGGVLSASEAGLQEVLGEPAFRGAAQYDAEQRGLVVLSTLRLDAARDSLEDSSIRGSMFHMLDPDTLRPLLSSNKLLMKKREPKSMLLGVPPAEGKPRKAFVALSSLFSTQRQQQIQLVSYQPRGQVAPVNSTAAVWNSTSQSDPPAPGAATGAEDCPVGLCSYEIIVNETVHLMKSFRLAGSAKEWLLVAGKRLLPEGGAGGASGLQFSIYSTTQENRNAKQVVQITAESGESEAFFDGAAAHLHDADGALYLALPVVRDAASQSTEEDLGCRLRSGGRFGGAFVWALLSDDRIEGDKIATPLAAVPDTGQCGTAGPQCLALSDTGARSMVPVKRVQFLAGSPQRLLTVSACAASVATLPLPDANRTALENVYQQTAHAPLFGCDCQEPA